MKNEAKNVFRTSPKNGLLDRLIVMKMIYQVDYYDYDGNKIAFGIWSRFLRLLGWT